MKETKQEIIWKKRFGSDYNMRNLFDNKGLDNAYMKDLGVSRTMMNTEFIGFLDRNIRILEVGCNVGLQLVNLQEMGFRNLFGIELQPSAVELARERTRGINIIQGTAYDIPFKDGFFDLVFTNRVLIHINPEFLDIALNEIHRVTSGYIYGSEYFAEELKEIKGYHGQTEIAWKRDFAGQYTSLFPDLRLIKEKKYKYTFNDDVDSTFLFVKMKAGS